MVAEKEFLAFVAGVMGVDAAALALNTAYESIPQWDSVMQLRLVMEIGSEYGVDFPLEKIPDLKTLGDFWAVVSLKVNF